MEENTQKTEEKQEEINWLEQEAQETCKHTEYDKLPSLKFEENKIVEFEVDFSKPFEKWDDTVNKVKKAIIPVTHKEEKKNLWLNTRNPLYSEIIHLGKDGQVKFKVIQVGNKGNTKYNLVKD